MFYTLACAWPENYEVARGVKAQGPVFLATLTYHDKAKAQAECDRRNANGSGVWRIVGIVELDQ